MQSAVGLLTNLGYEFFGIILPGFSMIVVSVLVVIVGGDVAVNLAAFFLPGFDFSSIYDLFHALDQWSWVSAFMLLIGTSYFFGHMLSWLARGGMRVDRPSTASRVWMTLLLKPPKEVRSYSAKMQTLADKISDCLLGEPEANWSHLYPVAKSYLLQSEARSVTTVYQNKYTLHRSFSVCCAIGAWILAGLILISLLCEVSSANDSRVHYPSSILLLSILLYAVKQFSDSYLYNWLLWGDYLIAETYCQIQRDQS